MKKTITFLSFFVLISSLSTSALSVETSATTTPTSKRELLIECKKTALLHRTQTMLPNLKEYMTSSNLVAEKEKIAFEKIQWYIRSAYNTQSKKIQAESSQAMIPVNEKITKARIVAQTTWKAEDALCELYHKTATTTPKETPKNTKRNSY